jgi:hypothetical protein
MKKKQYLNWNTHIQPHLNTLGKNQLLEVLTPVGSGKTTMINNYLQQIHYSNQNEKEVEQNTETSIHQKALIAHPYKVYKVEYAPAMKLGHDVEYFANIIENIKSIMPECVYDESTYIETFREKANEYLANKDYFYAFLDEIDFFFLQAQTAEYGATFQTKFYNIGTVTAAKLVVVTLEEMVKTINYVVSISANRVNLPFDVKYLQNRNPTLIKEIIMPLKPNTVVNSFKIINLNEFSNAMPTRIKKLLIQKFKDTPSLIYSPRFTKPEFKILMKEEIFIITRDENTPKVINSKSYLQNILHDYPKCIAVGDFLQRDLLTDKLLAEHKMLAVNTSNTRSLSLTGKYELATILLFTNTWTASVSQVCARFRNTPVDIIWVTNDTLSLPLGNHDVFLKDWLPASTRIHKPLKYFSTKYVKSKPLGKIQKRVLEAAPYFDSSKYKSMRAAYLAYKAIYPKGLSKTTFIKYFKKFGTL